MLVIYLLLNSNLEFKRQLPITLIQSAEIVLNNYCAEIISRYIINDEFT